MSDQDRTHVGRVKWFNNRRGYGFITLISETPTDPSNQEKSDVFVHQSNIHTNADVYRRLTAGEYVSFAISQDKKGDPMATAVTGVWGGPLLCEVERPRRNWAWDNYDDGRQGQRQQGRSHPGQQRPPPPPSSRPHPLSQEQHVGVDQV